MDRYPRLNDGTCYIYGLYDPRDGTLQYVGKSVEASARRVSHMHQAKYSRWNSTISLVHRWLIELMDQCLEPEMHILEICDEARWRRREQLHIAAFRPPRNDHPGGNGNDAGRGTGPWLWTVEEIEIQLEAFVRAHGRLPMWKERTDIHEAINRYTDTPTMVEWASKLGVASPKRSHWDHDSAVTALLDYLQDKERYPTVKQFYAEGLGGLHHAITLYHEGHDYWAKKLGMIRGDKATRWNEQRIRDELDAVMEVRDTWPSRIEFTEMGCYPLWRACIRRRGLAYWAGQYGCVIKGPKIKWDDALLEKELRAFVSGRPRWPTRRDFYRSGKSYLYRKIERGLGHRHWAEEIGLPHNYGAQ